MYLEAKKEGLLLSCQKQRDGAPFEPLSLRLAERSFTMDNEPTACPVVELRRGHPQRSGHDEQFAELDQRITEYLVEAAEPASKRQIRKAIQGSASRIGMRLDALAHDASSPVEATTGSQPRFYVAPDEAVNAA